MYEKYFRCWSKRNKCIVILGYYIGYQDLSRATNVGRDLVTKIYYPLFKDSRHWEFPPRCNMWENMPECSEAEKDIIEKTALQMMLKREQYYSDLKIRVPFFDFKGQYWRELEEAEKDSFGKQRAESHNKLVQYKDTFLENKEVLNDYIRLLKKKEINPIFVIAPFSKAYNRYVNEEMKENVVKMFVDNKKDIAFIDFNETQYFNDDDFVDTDHLNGRGAYKMSMLLANEYGR